MAIGLIPNRRVGSKAVWTVLLTIKRPVSWSILVPRDYRFEVGYGSKCLKLLQLEQGLYSGWNRDWFTAN